MKHTYETLVSLLDKLPSMNSFHGRMELSKILSEYIRILEEVNQTNEDYRRNTHMAFTEVSGIDLNIRRAESAKSQRQKDEAFYDAVRGLRLDIEALAEVIRRSEKF